MYKLNKYIERYEKKHSKKPYIVVGDNRVYTQEFVNGLCLIADYWENKYNNEMSKLKELTDKTLDEVLNGRIE